MVQHCLQGVPTEPVPVADAAVPVTSAATWHRDAGVDRISGISKKKKVSQNTLDRIPKWLKNPGR